MWAEAMGKLEGMDSADRERLWPQLVQGFKDLSQRLKVTFIKLCLNWIERKEYNGKWNDMTLIAVVWIV